MLAHWRAVSLPVLVTLYCLASSSSSVLATEQQDINTDIPTAQLLSKADIFLASGKGADALELYDIAVGKDKSSYVSGVCSILPLPFVDVALTLGPMLFLAQCIQKRNSSSSSRSYKESS